VIVSKINSKDLIVGDKNALLIATRILGYGAKYTITDDNETIDIDLSQLENKPFDGSNMIEGKNEFLFELPHSGTKITYKILNGHDENKISRELTGLKKLNKNLIPELSTRLKYIITSVEGDSEPKAIREFVDNYLLARDSRSFRTHVSNTQPDVDLTYIHEDGREVAVPMGLSFFWPDFGDSPTN
jgi:hypothetical protein